MDHLAQALKSITDAYEHLCVAQWQIRGDLTRQQACTLDDIRSQLMSAEQYIKVMGSETRD